MKKKEIRVLAIAGLMSALLFGCGSGGGTPETPPEPVTGTEKEITVKKDNTLMEETRPGFSQGEQKPESETGEPIFALPYQFVRAYGIIQSEYPVYQLETVVESELPREEKTISLTSAIYQKGELIVNIVLDDFSEVSTIPADGEPPSDGMYVTLSDGTMLPSERYQEELWKSGEGLFLTGPGIPETGIKPQESRYASYTDYFEACGHRRYLMEARFELPSAPGEGDPLSGYGIRLLDFEKPLEFTLKPAPEYDTLEELAAGEDGSIDTHDGISIISMGKRVEEGILISWYTYRETGESSLSITYKPPLQEIDMPTISGGGKQYLIKSLPYVLLGQDGDLPAAGCKRAWSAVQMSVRCSTGGAECILPDTYSRN